MVALTVVKIAKWRWKKEASFVWRCNYWNCYCLHCCSGCRCFLLHLVPCCRSNSYFQTFSKKKKSAKILIETLFTNVNMFITLHCLAPNFFLNCFSLCFRNWFFFMISLFFTVLFWFTIKSISSIIEIVDNIQIYYILKSFFIIR